MRFSERMRSSMFIQTLKYRLRYQFGGRFQSKQFHDPTQWRAKKVIFLLRQALDIFWKNTDYFGDKSKQYTEKDWAAFFPLSNNNNNDEKNRKSKWSMYTTCEKNNQTSVQQWREFNKNVSTTFFLSFLTTQSERTYK